MKSMTEKDLSHALEELHAWVRSGDMRNNGWAFVMMDACHKFKLARNMLQVNDDRFRPICTSYVSAAKSYI